MQNKWEEAKTPTPTHPIPLDAQMYIQELESRFERIVEQLEEEAYETEVWDERYTDKYYKGVSDGCKFAIEIVKGGVDNAFNRC